MPKKQPTAAKRARAAAHGGEKYTAALRRETTSPAAPTTHSYVPVADAGDEHVWARVVVDCPHCPCHAARVCADALWGRASRPMHTDGTPYTDPCPCEEAARTPEHRQLTLTFKGTTRTLDTEYHRIAGREYLLVQGHPFRAEPDDGSPANRCGMVLTRSKVMRTARDDHGDTWHVSLKASVAARPATITGWWTDQEPGA